MLIIQLHVVTQLLIVFEEDTQHGLYPIYLGNVSII